MRLSDIKTILHAEVLWGEEHLDREVFSACGSDFMSDVLAFVKNQALLLTGLVNPQVVRTADMVEMKCIVFVRGKVPGPDILSLAEERDIVVMTCPKRMYEACGLLYSNGLRRSDRGRRGFQQNEADAEEAGTAPGRDPPCVHLHV